MERIVQNPAVMGGKPCVNGTRITVEALIEDMAGGMSVEELLHEFPQLEREDVLSALRFAGHILQQTPMRMAG